ncbi:MAG: Gfo/Idh/MocA family oxidoreductase [bacterium]
MDRNACGVGIVGMDHWYIVFLAFDELGGQTDYPLVGVADREEWRLEAVRDRCPGLRTTEFDRIIEHPEIGLIVSMVNSAENPSVCRKALACGKHVISVKPPAMNLSDLDGLAEAANEHGKWFVSFESYRRLLGRSKKVREAVNSGRIGELVTYHQMTHAGLPQAWSGAKESGWWLDPERVCGGGWIDHAIYAVDTARWLFGEEIASVSGTMTNQRYADLPFEDYGVATLQFPSGRTAILEDSWLGDSFSGGEWIIGTKGSVRTDHVAFGNDPVIVTESGKETITADGDEKAFMNLCRGLFEENSMPFGPKDSRANLTACLAAYESARESRIVGLP